MEDIVKEIARMIGAYIPNLLGGLAILILGWLIALFVSLIVRGVLRRTGLGNRISRWIAGDEKAKTLDVARGISKGVYYLLMLFVLVAFFQSLGITLITEPLNRFLNQVFQFVPQLIGAGILVILAWIIASVLRLAVTRILSATKLDEQLTTKAGIKEEKQIPLTTSFANVVYWLVFLLFLPAVLSTLGVEGLLRPVQGMLNKTLDFLPNIFTAALILIVGWFVARIVQRLVTNLISAAGTDQIIEKFKLSHALNKQVISNVLGMLVYILILIPVIIAALNTLALEAITGPASEMLTIILGALPEIFAAFLIVLITYLVGKFVSSVVENLLTGIGFNKILVKLGLSKETTEGKWTPSYVIGYLVLLTILLFGIMEASDLLEFTEFGDLVSDFLIFAGHIFLGLIILGVGIYLANLTSKAVLATGTTHAHVLALLSRIAVIVLASAMALRQMGFANEIINLAFGLMLGAFAIAIAVAFGIGGREMAAKKLDEWFKEMKSK